MSGVRGGTYDQLGSDLATTLCTDNTLRNPLLVDDRFTSETKVETFSEDEVDVKRRKC